MTVPALRVVRGSPTAEELAAVVALLAAWAAAQRASVGAGQPAGRSAWAVPRLRRPLTPGPGAWRAAALPG